MGKPEVAERGRTPEEVLAIAKAQAGAMFALLGNLVGSVLARMPATEAIGLCVWLASVVAGMVFVYRLCAALPYGTPLVYCIGLLFPLIGIIILAALSSKATAVGSGWRANPAKARNFVSPCRPPTPKNPESGSKFTRECRHSGQAYW